MQQGIIRVVVVLGGNCSGQCLECLRGQSLNVRFTHRMGLIIQCSTIEGKSVQLGVHNAFEPLHNTMQFISTKKQFTVLQNTYNDLNVIPQ